MTDGLFTHAFTREHVWSFPVGEMQERCRDSIYLFAAILGDTYRVPYLS